jgi:hypothetical protein
MALCLSSVDPLHATVDFGGAIMGPTSSTAVSGSGLLGRFRFRAVEGFTGSTELRVTHLVLKSLSGVSQTDPNVVATLTSSGAGPVTGSAIQVSAGSVTGSAGGTVVMPVSVDNAKGVAGGDVTLSYDANLLTAKQVQGSELLTKAGITVVPNLSSAGKLQVSMAGVSGMASGSGVLLNVTFEIKVGAATGSTPVGLEALLADELGTALATTIVSGTVTISGGLVGDVNGDQKVNSADAILVLRFSAGLSTPTEAQRRAGDVNGDGKTNSGDAILILRKSAGLLAQFPRSGKASTEATDLVRLGRVERIGDEVVVPVELAAGAAGADLVLWGDNGLVQVTRLEAPADMLAAVQADGAGSVRLSVARGEALLPAVLRLHLADPGTAAVVDLQGQAYDEDGEVLGRITSAPPRPAYLTLTGYPNPFNASTTLQYELAGDAQVELVVYDATGVVVRRLVSSWQAAGMHSVVWNAADDRDETVATGVYLGCLQVGQVRQVHKLLLLK